MQKFGLIGFPLSHSFSKRYFTEKFAQEGLADTHNYDLYPLENIDLFPGLLQSQPTLVGLNVTIPYKQAVMSYLDELSPDAAAIGAVNTIKIEDGYLTGYNTDVTGFADSLEQFLAENQPNTTIKALILGTGGAALAVAWVLSKLGIVHRFVSRNPKENQLEYGSLNATLIHEYQLIINTTPLGMAPQIDRLPSIPYAELNEKHLLYDLVYNPAETAFLRSGRARGAATINGLPMLHGQAEKAWEIWTS